MGLQAPAYMEVKPSFTEPGLILPVAQRSGFADCFEGGAPRVRLGDGDLVHPHAGAEREGLARLRAALLEQRDVCAARDRLTNADRDHAIRLRREIVVRVEQVRDEIGRMAHHALGVIVQNAHQRANLLFVEHAAVEQAHDRLEALRVFDRLESEHEALLLGRDRAIDRLSHDVFSVVVHKRYSPCMSAGATRVSHW